MQVQDCDIFGDRGHRFPIPEATPDPVTDGASLRHTGGLSYSSAPWYWAASTRERSEGTCSPSPFPGNPDLAQNRPRSQPPRWRAGGLASCRKTQASGSPALNLGLHSDV